MEQPIMHTIILCVATTVLLCGCLDEYNPPEIQNSQKILVVEGNIDLNNTNIRLTQTNDLGQNDLLEVNNAKVILESETGSFSVGLPYSENGYYQTQSQLNYDENYRIRIQTESDTYISNYQKLLPTPPIDSLNWENVDDIFQVQVSTHDDNQNSRYYLWKYEETWMYRARFPSIFIWDNDGIVLRTKEQDIFLCWDSEKSSAIEIGTTINLAQNVVFKEPIHTIIPQSNSKLSRRYSILVKQYAISKEAFEFLQLLKKNSESLGTLFDPQPSQLTSNLTCTNNPQKQVIGFITASKEQQERIFVNKSELPFEGIPFAPPFSCKMDTIPLDFEELRQEFSSGRNLITFDIFDGEGSFVGYGSTPPSCADCRVYGGITEEPNFWTDE